VKRAAMLFGVVVAMSAAGSSTAAPRATTHLSAQDANYLQQSISGDRFEIIGGRLALQKGTTSGVRALAQRLVKDHSKSLAESVREAKTAGVKVPSAPTPTMVWELNIVRSMSGTAFDRWYSTLEVKDHQQDIEEATFEANHGSAPSIKQSAKKEIPTLEMHLALAQKATHGV
jgi:putative membrane protein